MTRLGPFFILVLSVLTSGLAAFVYSYMILTWVYGISTSSSYSGAGREMGLQA